MYLSGFYYCIKLYFGANFRCRQTKLSEKYLLTVYIFLTISIIAEIGSECHKICFRRCNSVYPHFFLNTWPIILLPCWSSSKRIVKWNPIISYAAATDNYYIPNVWFHSFDTLHNLNTEICIMHNSPTYTYNNQYFSC